MLTRRTVGVIAAHIKEPTSTIGFPFRESGNKVVFTLIDISRALAFKSSFSARVLAIFLDFRRDLIVRYAHKR